MVVVLLLFFASLSTALDLNPGTPKPEETLFTSKPLNFYSPQLLPTISRELNLPENDVFNLRSLALPNRNRKFKFNENGTSETTTSSYSNNDNGQNKINQNDKDNLNKINFNIKVIPPVDQNQNFGQQQPYGNQRPQYYQSNQNSGDYVNYVQPNQDSVTNNPIFGFTVPSQYSTEVTKDGNVYKYVIYV